MLPGSYVVGYGERGAGVVEGRSPCLEDAAAPLEGMAEGEFVGELDVPTHGQTGGQAGDGEVGEVFEDAGQVAGGGFADSIGVGGQDNFADVDSGGVPVVVFNGLADAGEEVADVELVGADAFKGVERATEDVVAAMEFAGAFNGLHVFGFFDDADDVEVSFGVGADAAGVGFRDVAADVAVGDAVAEGGNGIGKAVYSLRLLVEEVEGDALGAFWPDSGETSELVDEVLDGSFVHYLSSKSVAPRVSCRRSMAMSTALRWSRFCWVGSAASANISARASSSLEPLSSVGPLGT